jgi:hypothetical protein
MFVITVIFMKVNVFIRNIIRKVKAKDSHYVIIIRPING